MRFRSIFERLGLVPAPTGENVYHAFISYSHAVDGKLAPALQRGLQRFAKPWYRARAVRIFRDEASLSADPGLWSSIANALERSQHLILLASPQAAQSPWVAREAGYWREHKPMQNVLLALTEGELVWDEEASAFDGERTTALPETLRDAFREVPRFVDLRWAHSGEQLSLSHPEFRDAIAELAAPLHGRPKDELAGEEVRQHRRTVRIARAAALTLLALTAASIFFGMFALLQRNEARRQRDIATTRGLVQAAEANLDRRLDLASLLSLEAYRVDPTPEARSSLIGAIERSEHMVGLLYADQPVDRIAFNPDRSRLAAAGTRNVVLWNLGASPRTRAVLPVSAARALAFGPDGETLAAGGPDAISLWSLGAQPQLTRKIPFRGAAAIAFTSGGRRLIAVGGSGVAVYDVSSGTAIRRRPLATAVAAAAFAPGKTVVAIGGLREVTILDTGGTAPTRRLSTNEPPRALAFSPDGVRLAAVDLRGDGVTVWETATRKVLRRIRPSGLALAIAFAPDGRTLVLGKTDGNVELRQIAGSAQPMILRGPAEQVFDVAYPEGALLATAGAQGIVALWDPSSSAVQTGLARLDPIFGVDFAEQADSLAVSGFDDSVYVWTFEDGVASRRELRTTPDEQTTVASDRAGRRVAVADGGVFLYEADGKRVRLQPAARGAPVRALAFGSRDVVAWGISGRVGLWDAANGRPIEPLLVDGMPADLAFSGDGKLLAVAGENGWALWDLAERRFVAEPVQGSSVHAIAMTRSGRVVAAATAGEIVVWDAQRKRTRFAVSIPPNELTTLSFSPDEETVAVGTNEGRLLLIDADSGQRLGAPLVTAGGPVSGLDFSADGATLATGTKGGVVTLWDDVLWSDVAAMKRRLCAVAGRNLTRGEWSEFLPGQSYRATCP